MNISVFYSNGNVYVNCECIKGHTFKNAALWVKSALLPILCANFGLSRDNYVHFCRFEYLLPRISQV